MDADKVHGVKRRLVYSPTSPKSPVKQSGHTYSVHTPDVPLNKGQAVYVFSIEDAWKEAVVVHVDATEKVVTVKLNGTQEVAEYCADELLLRYETPIEDLHNLTHVTPVHEASILTCLHKRFTQDQYYTNAGTTVVAVNPFKDVNHLYTVHQIQAYHRELQDLPPHIYPVARTAYSNLVRELGHLNQSIIISGESGAGKTVSAKHLLRYLTITSKSTVERKCSSSSDKGVKIEQRIVDSNPILEAFGNAATPRNNNSSRFGKFIELQFLRMGQIQGGSIQTYLLEKTRVMHQGEGENNFHVFYQMTGLEVGDAEECPEWVQNIQREVHNLSFTCVPHNQDCSENRDLRETLGAMTNIGLCADQQKDVFQVLLAILYLGDLHFVQVNDDNSGLDTSFDCSLYCEDSDDDSIIEVSVSERALVRSCQLLGVDPTQLRQTLLNRSLQAGSRARYSVLIKPIGVAEASSRRDCLAMLLYSRLFEWLVAFINSQIKADFFQNIIGLLDIYGFEIFANNSLEQLCINYANERLQQHYVAHFLHSLQAEYTEECIPWVPVDYSDNRPCVNILDGRTSVFSMLNEEVYLNRKTDNQALKDRLLHLSEKSQKSLHTVQRSAGDEPCFVIEHYAGEVHYSVCDLVVKNKDDIPADLVAMLAASHNHFVYDLFSSFSQPLSPVGKKKKTVLTKFKSSLDDLMSSLAASDIHYIRCLRPNDFNVPGVFQAPYVLQQLRACGTIETVNICRKGYPARMTYTEFQRRYSVILRSLDLKQQYLDSGDDKENLHDPLDLLMEQQLELHTSHSRTPTPKKKLRRRTGLTQHDHARKVCATVLQVVTGGYTAMELQQQFGRSKLFLTEMQLERLECGRLRVLNQCATLLQSVWRGWRCRQWYRQAAAVRTIWRAWLTFCTRRQYLCLREAAVILQRGVRQWLYRLHLRQQEEAAHQEKLLQLAAQQEEAARLEKLLHLAAQQEEAAHQEKLEAAHQEKLLHLAAQQEEAAHQEKLLHLAAQQEEAAHQEKQQASSPDSDKLDLPPGRGGQDEGECLSHSPLCVEPDSMDCASSVPADSDTIGCVSSRMECVSSPNTDPDSTECVSSPRECVPSAFISPDSTDWASPTCDSPSDHDGNLSDDSGVMVHEPVQRQQQRQQKLGAKKESERKGAAVVQQKQGAKKEGERKGAAVVQQKQGAKKESERKGAAVVQQKLGAKKESERKGRARGQSGFQLECLLECVSQLPRLQGVHIGDGVVSRHRVAKSGVRFHTRASVLCFGHVINWRELCGGLLDAIGDEAEGSSVDP